MERFKVEGNTFLERDANSKAIVNTNRQALENAKILKQRALDNNSLKDKINTLEAKISDQDNKLNKILELLNGITNNT